MLNARPPDAHLTLFTGCAEGFMQGEFDFSDKTLANLVGKECFDMT